jgi:hypothetical protein
MASRLRTPSAVVSRGDPLELVEASKEPLAFLLVPPPCEPGTKPVLRLTRLDPHGGMVCA